MTSRPVLPGRPASRARRAFPAAMRLALLLSLFAVVALGCKRDAPSSSEERELVVFAAASLREAFLAIGEDFERTHPGVEVTLHFAGTQQLRTQLEHGAAVDVFASADARHMDALFRAGLVEAPLVFARNAPVLVVSKEAAGTIRSLADLPTAARVVIGAPAVPIGRYTNALLERASSRLGADFRSRVEARVVSRELNVRQVLTKVRLGEAEAGIVYRTDATTTADVTVVDIPADMNVMAAYPIAVVTGAKHPKLARAWLAHVRAPSGQAILARAGFLAPGTEPSPVAAPSPVEDRPEMDRPAMASPEIER